MNSKKIILIVVILIIVLLLLGSLYKDKEETPIITIVAYNGTCITTIKYYKEYATYNEEIGGDAGMIALEEEKIIYNEKVDFRQLKNEIAGIAQNKKDGKITIYVGNKKVVTTEENKIVEKMLAIVNMESL